ncbi:MAG: hypothetical protein IRZ14_11930, partial [Chloroflexi bacterium]|nr:hypothetical protein [Chloroflexota bacterium]
MPLVWESPDGRQRFALTVLGYEFPEGADDYYDANWLLVRVVARDGETTWSVDDPALLTWELDRLARWLERVAQGRFDRQPWCSFVEPNLEFRADPLPGPPGDASAPQVQVRVFFELELRPPHRPTRAVGQRDV